MRLAALGASKLRPDPQQWVIGWRPALPPDLALAVALWDFHWCVTRIGMDAARMARPSLPRMDTKEDHKQLSILFSIRASTLNSGFLEPDDSLKLATVYRSGHAVWWAWVKWAGCQ